MATAITTTYDHLRDAVSPTVYVRQHWTGTWTAVGHLQARRCEWSAGPKPGSAELLYRHGTAGRRQGEGFVFSAVNPLDYVGYWVKISIPQTTPDAAEGSETGADPLCWYGRIERVADDRSGEPNVQTLHCRDMSCVLDLEIRESWYDGGAGDRRVAYGLEFNAVDRGKPDLDERPQSMGNRSLQVGAKGVYVFAGPEVSNLQFAQKWSTREILDYLSTYHAPQNSTGDVVIPIELDAAAARDYLPPDDCDYDWPKIPTHGRTFKQLLDALLDRRRLLGYVLEVEEVDDDNDKLVIRPFTFADVALSLSGGATWLTPNQDDVTVTPATALEIVQDTRETIEPIDQCRAVGDPVVLVGTLKATGEASETTIIAGWTEAQQTDYNSGASGEAGYGSLTRAEKQEWNRRYRSRDDLKRVYSYFNAAPSWPEDDDAVTWSSPIPDGLYSDLGLDRDAGDRLNYRPALRFEPHLPLKVGYDYSVKISVYGLTDTTPDTGTWEYLEPLVILKLHDDLDNTSGAYHVANRLSAGAGIEGLGDGHGRDFSVSCRVQNDAAGVVLQVHGYQQHAIAASDFSAADDTDTSDAIPAYDWQDELILTIGWKTDTPLQKRYPETVATTNPTRAKILDARGRATAHIILADTVVAVGSGGELITSDEQWIRDDRELLEDAARIGYEWYGVERQSVTLTYRGAQNAALFPLGSLVTSIDGDAVRTVISSVRVEISDKKDQPHRTTVRTQWAELDVLSLLG